jgi:acylphosphatase
VLIHGRVQGVWFRGSTAEQARSAGVRGWVRNRADGSVEAVFEGDPDGVAALLGFCRRGPRHARVERVDEFEEEPEDLRGFTVL